MIAALLIWQAPAAYAFSDGIPSTIFGGAGCPLCHSGGVPPTVVLSGPSAVAPGATVEYTFTVFGNTTQRYGGLNVAAPVGVLSTGGPFAAGMQTVSGLLGLAEISHTEPKQGDFLNAVEFSFLWTAPVPFAGATLRAWGNAVNGSDSPSGDAAALATLNVVAAGGDDDTPTPTATTDPAATPTATLPPGVCSDAQPAAPALLSAPLAQSCQAAIAKAGAAYVKKDHKAVRKCLLDLQGDDEAADPLATCVGSAQALPSDADTAEAIVEAQDKALSLLADKCPDAALRAIDACGDSLSELAVCFLGEHRQAVVAAAASQFGNLTPSDDTGVLKCQKAIAGAAAHHLVVQLRATQKCLVKRNKAGLAGDGAALCIGAHAGGEFLAPLEPKTAEAASVAAAKLSKAIESKCSDAQISALDTCGSDRASAVDCLLCVQRAAVFSLVAAEFGASP